jgi:PAS domain-containing protein
MATVGDDGGTSLFTTESMVQRRGNQRERGIAALNVEVAMERPDGSGVRVLVNFAPLRDACGDVVGAIASFIDIIDR